MTPFMDELYSTVQKHGGFFNAHLHLDRAGTYHRVVDLLSNKNLGDGTALPLHGKHATIPLVHASECYDPDVLYKRTAEYIEKMIGFGTRRADSVVDTTTDRVGLTALECFARLKADYADRIDFRFGAYSPLGFRDDEPQRWELLREGAKISDFIGLLPERDDQVMYPQHIGFDESCRRAMLLAHEHNCDIHIHVDQSNHAYEFGSEAVLKLCRELKLGRSRDQDPFIWLIHVISPSSYEQSRFEALAHGLAEQNIGVICCPTAAISMRQVRALSGPIHNSIARVLELVTAGVHVRIGSDNICDITSPLGTPNLMDELRFMADVLRYYDIDFLARIGAGQRIDEGGRARLAEHLQRDQDFASEVVRKLNL